MATQRSSSSVPIETLLCCCPFSFIERAGTVTRLGRYFAKQHPEIAGQRFEDAFAQVGHMQAACSKERVELSVLADPDLHIVGGFLKLEGNGDGRLFLGTLSPRLIAKVTDLGLTMSDFGPFDVSADFAMMAQVNEAVLRDTRLLNDRLAAARDEAVRAKEKIEAVALVDALSGLANRAAFQHALDAQSENAAGPRSLLLVDIDNFKPVNDHYGHAVGDLLIKSLGDRIAVAADGNADAYRIGGDEFALIFKGLTSYQAKARAGEIMRAIEVVHDVQGKHIAVKASGGLASRMFGVNDLESLYKAADIALYEAKRSKSSKLQIFTAGMGRRELEQKLLERDLVEAVREKALDVFVQPQFDLATGALSGGEALSRWWNRRLQRYVPPEVFVPIAEKYGLVAQIDLFVFTAVLRQQHALDQSARTISWSSNLSPLSIGRVDVVHRMQEIMEQEGVPVAPTEIEITESAVLTEAGDIGATLHAVRAMGIDVAIDDFGAGQTSLSHLTELPVTRLKLDRSLVERIDNDERAEMITRAIVALAQELGLRVTAEGVERPSQAERLRCMGPMKVQGFLYGHPMPMEQFVELVLGEGAVARKKAAVGSPRLSLP